LECDMKVAVFFCSQINYATRESIPFCSDQMRSELGTKYSVGPCQLNMSDGVTA
jgi:hypothetical protein